MVQTKVISIEMILIITSMLLMQRIGKLIKFKASETGSRLTDMLLLIDIVNNIVSEKLSLNVSNFFLQF